ncbi:MAG TPA: NERD domain-containing protein [Marinobacter sp.]|uniref:NERD domain-containing protein n=3 Tax=root TaxID=1 RepID=A0A831R015_9GAMM|nr:MULTISPECIES: nuclease-related domain-containing protein [Marinobacter]ABM21239.1 NERD domain protein [Marinobacter nauticus VT8]HDZ38898.1 NERD domain-containing protein [Marinobacter sp.]HEA51648.1 NERD domain-containing protein [Marinobacter antarcticus]
MPDYRRMAGEKQESQVSYFLDRYFGHDDSYRILNNLKIEINGFTSQIDHLIIYKAGFIVIESKSIQGSVRVNSAGEWERSYKDQWFGIASPVQQAAMQIDNLKALLRDNSTQLLGKLLGIQKGFGLRQYKTVIAISSSARLDRDNIPSDISKHIVKSEFLVEKVKELTEASNSGLKSFAKSEPRFTCDEMERIFEFLRGYQQPLEQSLGSDIKLAGSVVEPKKTQNQPAIRICCKNCGETSALSAQYGRFGYYIRCEKCLTNTALKQPCPACNSSSTKTRKSKSNMYLDCLSCHQSVLYAVEWGAGSTSN